MIFGDYSVLRKLGIFLTEDVTQRGPISPHKESKKYVRSPLKDVDHAQSPYSTFTLHAGVHFVCC